MGAMDQDILKVLYTEKEIAARVERMGKQMYEDLQDKNPLFVSVLRGAFIFMADIVRACQVKSDVEFIAVSSYGNAMSSSGAVQITRDIQQDISGRNLVVIEDILDSGNTLFFLKQYFMTKGAASVSICTLLDKPSRRAKAITADYTGFVVPDEFVVWAGLLPEVPEFAVYWGVEAGGIRRVGRNRAGDLVSQRLGSDIKVLFDTFSFKKKYDCRAD